METQLLCPLTVFAVAVSVFKEESCRVSAIPRLIPAVAECELFIQSTAAPFVLRLVAPGLGGGCHGPGILSSQHD